MTFFRFCYKHITLLGPIAAAPIYSFESVDKLFLSASTSSTVGSTKSNFQIHTLPAPFFTSSTSKPSSAQRSGSFSTRSSRTSDFFVAKTGSVPRKGGVSGVEGCRQATDSSLSKKNNRGSRMDEGEEG